jgi:hypothetical protein
MVGTTAGWVALIALAGTVGSLASLHVAPSGLSPVRDPVSQYGITRFRGGYRFATVSFGIAAVALAVGLGSRLQGPGVPAVIALLAVFAAGRLCISWFPMDEPGTPPTPTGRSHGLIAIATFASATVAALRLAPVLETTTWHSLAPVSRWLGVVELLLILGMFGRRLVPQLGGWFGAIERGLYLAMIVWFGTFAIACIS